MGIQEFVPKPAIVAVETLLKVTVERSCPECGGTIPLDRGTMDGDIVNCGDCTFELEVVFFNPEDPGDVQKIMKIAQKRGPKKGEKYDVSHLNLKESPSFIPSPQEEEDWGE